MVAESGSGLTHEEIQAAEGLLRFIDESPSAFHAVSALRARFDEAGFVFLPETQTWSCKPGGCYYTKAHPLTHPAAVAAGFSSILGSIEVREIMGNPEQHTQSISKRRVLIVAACIAAATFVLLICAEIFLPSKPPSFFGLGFGPSSTTGFMVLLGPALAAWAFSIYVRCPDATIRNQLIAIAALLRFGCSTLS